MSRVFIFSVFTALVIGFSIGVKVKAPLIIPISQICNDYYPPSYKDLDHDLVINNVVDTVFRDTICIHFGNHPGSISWENFIVKHFI